ncbi:hypothetical protein [Anaerocolumna xylanovorans]|uniref:Uncharacterized protein n=1 Tax=Anaerocolumna xylanovorans DSM 12503 TaxID=1121345 RepID=A0A1M7YA83_9FIRM|nr:hypothetical protein [Anaerocolumna xylanovorans]SHO49544.1 hypothetical protein SAMN02745217_02379 [Anaerocolumna xylanovorans DSM 12503]
MKRLKNMIIPILCVLALLLFAGEPLREANAKTLNQTAEAVSRNGTPSGSINQQEANIVRVLTDNISIAGIGKNDYESFLLRYFGQNGMDAGTDTWGQAEAKAAELNNLMKLEKKATLKELPADGREIAIGLTKDIFSACGLSAGISPSGELISLSDKTGSLTLVNGKTYKQHINSGVLMLVISIVGILQIICYILSRKSRIMIKDVKHNGFHKEEFAG